MARINQRSIDLIDRAQRGAARVNNHNSAAIIAAQQAFVSCACAICTAPPPNKPGVQCPLEATLWRELERGEDMYLAAHGVQP